jgi:hypothetical protein
VDQRLHAGRSTNVSEQSTGLTGPEKEFLALAIQGLCMRQGPGISPAAWRVAEKLGITEQLGASLRDWIRYAHAVEQQNEDRR